MLSRENEYVVENNIFNCDVLMSKDYTSSQRVVDHYIFESNVSISSMFDCIALRPRSSRPTQTTWRWIARITTP